MNQRTILLSLFLMSILLSSWIAKADIPDGHKPIPCIGCHKETLGASAGDSGDECDNCHEYRLPGGGINVPLMQEQHNPKICTACHIGNTEVDGSNRDLFHNAHNTVKCSRCHVSGNATDNNSTGGSVTVVGIEPGRAFQCTSCHGNQIHAIHMKNLSQGCPICHGSWAAGKVYSGFSSSSQESPQQNAIYEHFTIIDFIKNLFNEVLGIK